jgi:hypothetical protein
VPRDFQAGAPGAHSAWPRPPNRLNRTQSVVGRTASNVVHRVRGDDAPRGAGAIGDAAGRASAVLARPAAGDVAGVPAQGGRRGAGPVNAHAAAPDDTDVGPVRPAADRTRRTSQAPRPVPPDRVRRGFVRRRSPDRPPGTNPLRKFFDQKDLRHSMASFFAKNGCGVGPAPGTPRLARPGRDPLGPGHPAGRCLAPRTNPAPAPCPPNHSMLSTEWFRSLPLLVTPPGNEPIPEAPNAKKLNDPQEG